MRKTYRIFSSFFVFVLLFTVWSCQDSEDENQQQTPADGEESTSGSADEDKDTSSEDLQEDEPEEDPFVIPADLGSPPSGTARIRNASLLANTKPTANDALREVPDTVSVTFTEPALEGSAIRIFQNKQAVEQEEAVFDGGGTRMTVAFEPLSEFGVFDVLYKIVHEGGEESGYFMFYVERREFEGERLDSVLDFRENSIKGPQYVDLEGFRLRIEGLVDTPLELSYEEVLQKSMSRRAVTLNCVEGWSAHVLWEGIPLMDLLNEAGIQADAVTVIFQSYDDYTTSVSLNYLEEQDLMLAYAMNDVSLPAMRGFPFHVVAEDKWGYKWGKWVYRIILSDDSDYRGFWESYGYNQNGDHDGPIFDKRKRANVIPYCGHFE